MWTERGLAVAWVGRGHWALTATGWGGSLGAGDSALKLIVVMVHNAVNVLKPTGLCTLTE